jgi:hypothetical protein
LFLVSLLGGSTFFFSGCFSIGKTGFDLVFFFSFSYLMDGLFVLRYLGLIELTPGLEKGDKLHSSNF